MNFSEICVSYWHIIVTLRVLENYKREFIFGECGSAMTTITEMILQEKDMAVAALTISSQREEVVDFTVPFHDEAATVVLKVSATYYI